MPAFTTIPLGRRGGMQNPQRKPWGGAARFELDPRAPLSQGLAMGLVIDGPQGVGGMYDYARPMRKFTASVGTPTFLATQFGGLSVNSAFNTTTEIDFTPAIPATNTSFSFSALVQFDGSGHGDLGIALLSDGTFGGELVSTQTATNSPLLIGGSTNSATSFVLFLALLTGWHRIGATVNGSACRFFLDGRFEDAVTMGGTPTAGPCNQFQCCSGQGSFAWGWNTADTFLWNRALTDTEMLRNFVSPYRSILRPKFSESNTPPTGTPPKKGGAFMLQGVG